jgi:CPA2 family monovalent cation:H+ antiporter-2
MHGEFNLTEITIVALAALAGGLALERARQPAVIGYILAGVILGPSMLGLVENREFVSILAELGVLLLLFLVGMELELTDFKKVWKISLFTTLGQIVVSLLVMYLIGMLFSIPFGLTVLLACSVALSSTAVAVKMTEGIQEDKTAVGRLTVGVLIAQDLAVVPIILVLRGLSLEGFDPTIALRVLGAVVLLGGVIWFLGKRDKIQLPFSQTLMKQKDLLPLLSLAFCFGMATISGIIGLSAAYGAFLAGLVLGNTTSHHSLMKATQPIQSILMMVFFLSIGLLMDLQYIWHNLGKVLMLLVVITLGKSLLNILLLSTFGATRKDAFLSGLLLAQMGEFAFVLTTVGLSANLIDTDGSKLVISLAALSLSFSPFWLAGARRLHDLAPASAAKLSFSDLMETAFGQEFRSLHKAGVKIMKWAKSSLALMRDKTSDNREQTPKKKKKKKKKTNGKNA